MRTQRCIPPRANGAFVWRMEEVLEVSTRPYDARFPHVCRDETSVQLPRDVRPPLPATPDHPHRFDVEYERGGVLNLFLCCEPLTGRRWVTVTERRTKLDWAHQIQDLVDERFPGAERIVLVQDNRNTHTPAALYDAFPPAGACRLLAKLEPHDTPKRGSWLNMAEIEFSVLSRQCPARRVPDRATLEREIAAWQARRTAAAGPIDWRFTTRDARITLKRLYPSVQE